MTDQSTKIEFYRHNLGEEEQRSVQECLRGLLLTTGGQVAAFEEGFSEYTGLPCTVALNSCTAALHLALLALDIGPGDEVITTPMTFIATATSILHTGARPVRWTWSPTPAC
jgi:UDP-4-amino-4-deoxy-L-arabinose-oxoglutarate aminotransferase